LLNIQRHLKKIFTNTSQPRYKILQHLIESQYYSPEILKKIQLNKLNKLLSYSQGNVPYYSKMANERLSSKKSEPLFKRIEELNKLPLLTKDIIRIQGKNLYSSEYKNRKPYQNTSGGSTGEPVKLIQDSEYYENSEAHFLLAQTWRKTDIFDSTIHLWGAERDTFYGRKPLIDHLKDFLKNRIILNSFTMSDCNMIKYINILNKHKPKLIISYAQSIYELAKFARTNNFPVEKQNAVHTSASTLYDFMRTEIEEIFSCKCFDHYGSREVGAIASECSAHDGLHVFTDNIFVEIVDKNGHPCPPGIEGEVIVTTLNNYSMPLIRYKIGDIGIIMGSDPCPCGCNYPKLQKVTGRSTESFKTSDGEIVDGEFFTHLFYHLDGIKQFQIIQQKHDEILVNIIEQGKINNKDLAAIENRIKDVMGSHCRVEYRLVRKIEKTATGKLLYTISNI